MPSSGLLLPTPAHCPTIKSCGFYHPLASTATAMCGEGPCHFPAARLSLTALESVSALQPGGDSKMQNSSDLVPASTSPCSPLTQPQIRTSIHSVPVTHLAAGDTAVTQADLAPVMPRLCKPHIEARQPPGPPCFPARGRPPRPGIFHSAHAEGTVVSHSQLALAHLWEPCTCPSLCMEHPFPTHRAAT